MVTTTAYQFDIFVEQKDTILEAVGVHAFRKQWEPNSLNRSDNE
jgi:hypothetical protein